MEICNQEQLYDQFGREDCQSTYNSSTQFDNQKDFQRPNPKNHDQQSSTLIHDQKTVENIFDNFCDQGNQQLNDDQQNMDKEYQAEKQSTFNFSSTNNYQECSSVLDDNIKYEQQPICQDNHNHQGFENPQTGSYQPQEFGDQNDQQQQYYCQETNFQESYIFDNERKGQGVLINNFDNNYFYNYVFNMSPELQNCLLPDDQQNYIVEEHQGIKLQEVIQTPQQDMSISMQNNCPYSGEEQLEIQDQENEDFDYYKINEDENKQIIDEFKTNPRSPSDIEQLIESPSPFQTVNQIHLQQQQQLQPQSKPIKKPKKVKQPKKIKKPIVQTQTQTRKRKKKSEAPPPQRRYNKQKQILNYKNARSQINKQIQKFVITNLEKQIEKHKEAYKKDGKYEDFEKQLFYEKGKIYLENVQKYYNPHENDTMARAEGTFDSNLMFSFYQEFELVRGESFAGGNFYLSDKETQQLERLCVFFFMDLSEYLQVSKGKEELGVLGRIAEINEQIAEINRYTFIYRQYARIFLENFYCSAHIFKKKGAKKDSLSYFAFCNELKEKQLSNDSRSRHLF